MATFRWNPAPAADLVTAYHLEKSEDGGLTFTEVVVIDNDTTITAAFDAALKKFYWVDPTPVAGEIVRMAAENDQGLGPYAYTYAPPTAAACCNLFGVVVDPMQGQPLAGIDVRATILQLASVPNASVAGLGEMRASVGGPQVLRTTTDAGGRWQLDLVQGIVVTLSIPDAFMELTFRVPARTVLNVRDAYQYRSQATAYRSGGRGGGVAT